MANDEEVENDSESANEGSSEIIGGDVLKRAKVETSSSSPRCSEISVVDQKNIFAKFSCNHLTAEYHPKTLDVTTPCKDSLKTKKSENWRAPPSVDEIDAFIEELAATKAADDVCNFYARCSSHESINNNNAIRRQNLRLYLQAMAKQMPETLLVMEAPGYRGCRLTGVPVTSRQILVEGISDLQMFGSSAGYCDVSDESSSKIMGEQSATIVWNTCEDLGIVPFIWNIFPFHPHKTGKPQTNRKPRKKETLDGAVFVKRIISLWHFNQIVAIGNVAFDTLNDMGHDCVKIRHPAQGGKHDFVCGLTNIFGRPGKRKQIISP